MLCIDSIQAVGLILIEYLFNQSPNLHRGVAAVGKCVYLAFPLRRRGTTLWWMRWFFALFN